MSNVSVPKIPLSNFECVHCGRIYYDADLCSSDDCPGNDIAMPELLNHWTVDEVAECLDGVGQELYRKLWSYIEATTDGEAPLAKEGANKQVISSQADSLIKISRIWADFFPANTSNQPI